MLNILKRVVGVVAVLVVGAAGCSSETESVVDDSDSPVMQDPLEGLRVVKEANQGFTLTNATMGPVHLESAVLNRGVCTMTPHESILGDPILGGSDTTFEEFNPPLPEPILLELGAQFPIIVFGCEPSPSNIVFIELNFTEGSRDFSWVE